MKIILYEGSPFQNLPLVMQEGSFFFKKKKNFPSLIRRGGVPSAAVVIVTVAEGYHFQIIPTGDFQRKCSITSNARHVSPSLFCVTRTAILPDRYFVIMTKHRVGMTGRVQSLHRHTGTGIAFRAKVTEKRNSPEPYYDQSADIFLSG
jgi:hypothetical protein